MLTISVFSPILTVISIGSAKYPFCGRNSQISAFNKLSTVHASAAKGSVELVRKH